MTPRDSRLASGKGGAEATMKEQQGATLNQPVPQIRIDPPGNTTAEGKHGK